MSSEYDLDVSLDTMIERQKMQKRKELKEKKKKQIPKKVGTKPKLANKNGTQPVATKVDISIMIYFDLLHH